MCEWLVTVKLRGNLVVSATCKNRQKRKWKTQDKRRTVALPIYNKVTRKRQHNKHLFRVCRLHVSTC